MAFKPEIHHRQSIRMPSHDYSQPGVYFITVCTHHRAHRFGEIIDGRMSLNEAGLIAHNCWREIPMHFPAAFLDECVIMPNHMHGIVIINGVGANNHSPNENTRNIRANNHSPNENTRNIRANDYSPLQNGINGTSKTVGSIIRGFKIGVTRWYRNHGYAGPIWQRNYWERIIRDEREMQSVRKYIRNNPAQWQHDDLNDW